MTGEGIFLLVSLRFLAVVLVFWQTDADFFVQR